MVLCAMSLDVVHFTDGSFMECHLSWFVLLVHHGRHMHGSLYGFLVKCHLALVFLAVVITTYNTN